ncbi:VWA domain-containing protein [Candidatus Woesearchaeota archaeon]|nr:VWA domain-containing protein [Candidatus Woesearchaeota archaeon]
MLRKSGKKSLERVVSFDTSVKLKDTKKIEELAGKLKNQAEEEKLMHSVLENDKKAIKDGKIIMEAINQGLNSFTPDLMFQQLVKNYSVARQIYGHSLMKLISGYNPDYIKKNINIPEFQKELKEKIEKNADELKEKKLITNENTISEKGIELASLVMYFEELDNITPKGLFGERIHKKAFIYGDKDDFRNFKSGDRYRDIAIKKSAKLAIRRGHKNLGEKDLKVFERQAKGQSYIIYSLDASGSMKGAKIDACKRAGIALAYKAINEKDKVGLIVFGSEIKEAVEPTRDFKLLLMEIAKIRASRQTDIVATLKKAIELFPNQDITKHLILITDALPTIGEEPENETLKEASIARNNGITISLIGINLNEKGRKLAEKIVEIGRGRLYVVRDTEKIDKIVLEDYYSLD